MMALLSSMCVCLKEPPTPDKAGEEVVPSGSQQSLPEKLDRMAASEFISDAAIRFKLGRAPPSELLTDSNSAARAFGHQV
jgi:hypothetical protein